MKKESEKNSERKNKIETTVKKNLKKIGIPTEGIGLEFIKNTSWVTFARLFEQVASYIIIIFLTRYLGVKGLGQYSFVFAFASFFFLFTDLGMSPLMVRDLSKDKTKINIYTSNILSLKTILIFLSLIVFLTVSFFVKKELFTVLILVSIIQTSSIITNFFIDVLRIHKNGKAIGMGLFIERLFALIFGVLILIYSKSLFWFVTILLGSYSLRTIYLFLKSKKYFKFHFVFDWKFLKKLLLAGYPFILLGVFTMIYARMDTVMLSFISGDVVTGNYNAAYKLINILNLIPTLLLMFGFPLFAEWYHKNKQLVKKTLTKMLVFSTVAMIPVILTVFLWSNQIIHLIYGFYSIEASQAFKILIVIELFVIFTTIIGSFFAATERQMLFAKISGLGALINIILNFLLIPKFSLYGAATATGITYITMFIIMSYFYSIKK